MKKPVLYLLVFTNLIFQQTILKANDNDSITNKSLDFLWDLTGIDVGVGGSILINDNKDFDNLLNNLKFSSELPKNNYGLNLKINFIAKNFSISLLYEHYFSQEISDENNYFVPV